MYSLMSGVSIVEAAAFVAAPLAGMTLAQLGAEVIRVDPIGGGLDHKRWPQARETGHSLYWAGLNKGKKSIAVNLSQPEGRELVQALATAADDADGTQRGILITNFATSRWLSQETLSARRADVISVAVKGNPDGSTAVDYTVNCAVGYPTLTGPDERPVNHVLPAWDMGCGLHAALGLLGALRHRERTGAGQRVEVSLTDVAMAMVGNLGQVAEVEVNGTERGPIGNDLYGSFGRDFETRDGRRVMLVALTPKQWQGLCRICGIEDRIAALETALGVDFGDESVRFEWRSVLRALIEPWILAHDLAAVGAALDEADLAWGPYQTVTEMLRDDPRASEANPMFTRIDHPGIGSVLTPGSPIDFGALAREEPGPAPLLGMDTDAVLADRLGLSGAEIGRLHDAGTVAGPA